MRGEKFVENSYLIAYIQQGYLRESESISF